MKNLSLARSYLVKTQKRLKILEMLLEENDYSDVIREAQELSNLRSKGCYGRLALNPPNGMMWDH